MAAGRPHCWRYKKRKWVAALPRPDKDISGQNHSGQFLTDFLAGPGAATACQKEWTEHDFVLGIK